MSIIIAILGFSLLVFVHELGHFIFAKFTGMEVEKFSIGFGPALYKFGQKTQYQIALLPFGGFVQIKGLVPKPQPTPSPPRTLKDIEEEWGMEGVFSPEDLNRSVEAMAQETPEETEEEKALREAEEQEGSFQSKSLWARFLVVSGGPLFNLAFTILVFWWLFGTNSAFSVHEYRTPTLTFKEVSGAAAAAGVKAGDVLLKINGEPVKSFYQLKRATVSSGGEPLTLTLARPAEGQVGAIVVTSLFKSCQEELIAELAKAPNQIKRASIDQYCAPLKGVSQYAPSADPSWPVLTLKVKPQEIKEGVYKLGLTPEVARFGGANLWQDLSLAYTETLGLIKLMTQKIIGGLRGTEQVEIASVVKITAITADTIRLGNEWFINFLAFLSLNLAFLNLLPFPALDGGRLIFLAIEGVSRRPVPQRVEMIVHGIGILILITLTLWVTAKDILSLL